MLQTAQDERYADCKALMDLATPELYQRNLFRMLDLGVRSTPRDVQRKQKRLEMQRKLGLDATTQEASLFRLHPAPDEEQLRDAAERMHRPVDRLLCEFFWLWPLDPTAGEDPGLAAVENGDHVEAERVWREAAESGYRSHVAKHNLAVLWHLMAMDLEEQGRESDLNAKQAKKLGKLWSKSLACWREVTESEDFWTDLRERIRELDDAQLTTGFARQVRASLPKALMLINAKAAYLAAEQGRSATVTRHVEILKASEFGEDTADSAIGEALKPVRNRIAAAAEDLKRRCKRAPQHGARYVREARGHVEDLVKVLDSLLPAKHPIRVSEHDAMADAMVEGLIEYGNCTNDWSTSLDLLKSVQQFALGDTVLERIARNVEIVSGNVGAGNDWCSPDYWDQPEHVTAQLQDARQKAVAGDFEGALTDLLSMPEEIGNPLRRCVAYCLVGHGRKIANEGWEDFNSKTPSQMQKFLDAIRRRGTVNVPHPEMQSWQLPACPSCASSHYTQWSHGTYNGQQFWMCSACATKDDAQRERWRVNLKAAICKALGYLLLAEELDGKDAGVKEAVKFWKDNARELGALIPPKKVVQGRKQELTNGRVHVGEPIARQVAPETTCYFCGENGPDDACAIVVPMLGERRTVKLLWGEGVEYSRTEVCVPRCRRCRAEHRELPERLQKWSEARLDVTDDANFPEEWARLVAAVEGARETEDALRKRKSFVEEAEAGLKRAKEGSDKCPECKCKWKFSLDTGLCWSCDREVTKFPGLWTAGMCVSGMAVLAAAVYAHKEFEVFGPLIQHVADQGWMSESEAQGLLPMASAVLLGFLIGLCLYLIGRRRLKVRKAAAGQKRLVAYQQQQETDVREAEELLREVTEDLERAQAAAEGPALQVEASRCALKKAVQDALDEFQGLHPEPRLDPSVRPEETYKDFGLLQELSAADWSIGDRPPESSGDEPESVRGLVSRPEPGASSRTEVSCPNCGERKLVKIPEEGCDVNCLCGAVFQTARWEPEQPASQSTSTTGEDRQMVQCPICKVQVLAKNLERHQRRVHSQAERARASGSAAPVRAPGECPRCGFSYGWDGTSCRHCGNR